MSAELQLPESEQDDPETLEILKDICFNEATRAREWLLNEGYRQLRYERASSIGKAVMIKRVGNVELMHDYFGAGFESKPFGLRDGPNDDELIGWTFSISGEVPEAMAWSGKIPPMQAFVSYDSSPISIEEVVIGPNNECVEKYPSGWLMYPRKKSFSIYEEREPLTVDKINELRVILETGLSKFMPGAHHNLIGAIHPPSLPQNT
jgi:hypothetical protein